MLGAMIGDIVGSVYEWDRIKTKDFPFFTDDCFFTDDSVCTVAVADILLHDLPPAKTMQNWCHRYPGCSYGGNFGDGSMQTRLNPTTVTAMVQRCGCRQQPSCTATIWTLLFPLRIALPRSRTTTLKA